MKRSILALAAGTFIAGAIIYSCKSPEEKVENAEENVIEARKNLDLANEEYLREIENYKIETAKEVEANEKAIADLEESIEHGKVAVKTEYKQKLVALKQKNHEMKEKMENYRAEGKEKWESFKAEFKHDMDEMGQAFRDLGKDNVR